MGSALTVEPGTTGVAKAAEQAGGDVQGRLCAAMYLDPELRDFALREIYNARVRWIAPSYGFDPVPILRCGWRAWRSEQIERLLLLVVLTAGIRLFPFTSLLVVAGLISWWMVWRLLAALREKLRQLTKALGLRHGKEQAEADAPHYLDWVEMLQQRLAFYSKGSAISLGAVVVLFVIALRREGDLEAVVWQAVAVLGAPAMAAMAFAVDRHMVLARLHSTRGRGPEPEKGRLAVIARQDRHAATVYSGTAPFIGSGIEVLQWSFVQRLLQARDSVGTDDGPEREFLERPFDTRELVAHLESEIADLGKEQDAEMRLPGIDVRHQVFVEGLHSLPYADFLDGGDNGEALIEQTLCRPGGPARHYLACRVLSWGGEVVTQVFVHASLQGRTLYLEFATQALAPTDDRYRMIDTYGATGKRAAVRAALRAGCRLPERTASVLLLAHAVPLAWNALIAQRRPEPPLRGKVDIGAVASLRERACGPDEEDDLLPGRRLRLREELDNYFQNADVHKHTKIIERRLLASLGTFLDDHGVQTAEFRERVTMILNHGIMNTGSGDVYAEGAAIGENAGVQH